MDETKITKRSSNYDDYGSYKEEEPPKQETEHTDFFGISQEKSQDKEVTNWDFGTNEAPKPA